MSFEIVTDSSANLTPAQIESMDLHIMSLAYVMEDKEIFSYVKGQEWDAKEFYDKLRKKISSKTSAANPQQAEDMFRPLCEQGKDILYVGFTSGLSATYDIVSKVLEEFKKEFPQRKIMHVDTLCAASGQGHMVRMACKLRKEGKSMEEVHEWIENNKLKMNHYFTVDDLFHLMRGGRVSAAKAIMGSALNVKPILVLNKEGKLVPLSKAKGRKKSLNALVDIMSERINPDLSDVVYCLHGDCEDDAKSMADQIKERHPGLAPTMEVLEPVIGTHCGAGLACLIFMGKTRED